MVRRVYAAETNMSVGKPKSSSLFVPRASVIRHTKDFKLQNAGSYFNKLNLFDNPRTVVERIIGGSDQQKVETKKEEKDSGIDESFDDDEDDKMVIAETDPADLEEGKSSPEHGDKILLPPAHPPPLKYMADNRLSNEYISRYVNRPISEEQLAKDFENSVVDILREPHLVYLLQLYQYADEGLLKETLLKLIKNNYITESAKKKAKSFLNADIELNKNAMPNHRPSIDFSVQSQLPDEKYRNHSESDSMGPSSDSYYSSSEYSTGNYSSSSSSNESMNTFMGNSPVPSIFSRSLSDPSSQQISYENNLQCEYCHKKFNNEEAAKRHLLTHKGKRTHKCTHCSRSFYEQSSYLRHLKSHNGEKAHKCDQCSMAFSKRSALEVHIRTHTGERPFVCKYCGKGFSISGNLHRHILIHTGHRPYKCGKCPRAFNNPSHLARHISSFHA